MFYQTNILSYVIISTESSSRRQSFNRVYHNKEIASKSLWEIFLESLNVWWSWMNVNLRNVSYRRITLSWFSWLRNYLKSPSCPTSPLLKNSNHKSCTNRGSNVYWKSLLKSRLQYQREGEGDREREREWERERECVCPFYCLSLLYFKKSAINHK